jgi:hypothetical protein
VAGEGDTPASREPVRTGAGRMDPPDTDDPEEDDLPIGARAATLRLRPHARDGIAQPVWPRPSPVSSTTAASAHTYRRTRGTSGDSSSRSTSHRAAVPTAPR